MAVYSHSNLTKREEHMTKVVEMGTDDFINGKTP